MRVALVVPGFSASETDWCIPVLLTLVRRMTIRLGVEIFTLRYPSLNASYDVAGARVHPLGGGRTRGWRRAALVTRAVARIALVHRRRPFDVIHALWADEPGLVAVMAARVLGRSAVVSVMGGELASVDEVDYGGQRAWSGRALARASLAGAARVTVGSPTLGRLVPASAVSRLRVWPLGVDLARFQPGPSAVTLEGPLRILLVGSLIPVKDHACMLNAMREIVAAVPAHLHVVGDGPLNASLQALAAALGLTGRVTFHGEVAHDRLPSLYRAADVCVVSSRFESQSMAAVEASACGTPVIGTRVGIVPELAAPGRVVSVGDASGLARAVIASARDGRKRSDAGRDARACVERTFDIEQTVDAIVDLYADVRRRSFSRARGARA